MWKTGIGDISTLNDRRKIERATRKVLVTASPVMQRGMEKLGSRRESYDIKRRNTSAAAAAATYGTPAWEWPSSLLPPLAGVEVGDAVADAPEAEPDGMAVAEATPEDPCAVLALAPSARTRTSSPFGATQYLGERQAGQSFVRFNSSNLDEGIVLLGAEGHHRSGRRGKWERRDRRPISGRAV